MALRDMFDRVRDSVTDMTRRFLHGEEQAYYDQQGYGPQEGYYDPAHAAYGQTAPYDGSYQQQQPHGQQQYQQQQPYQQNYQQENYPPQEGYQSPYAGSYARQGQPQSQQRAQRGPSPNAEKVVPFPGMSTDGTGNVYTHELQILQLRDRDECRAIIEYLKNNCTVALNMDNIANDTEKQRCVDMLSGAAYTLNCNISRISTRGVYMITPESVRVSQDEATRRLNGAARQAAQRPSRAHSYAAGRSVQGQGQEVYETPQDGGYAGYPPQGGYGYQEETAPQGGYQSPYGNEGEYRTESYYTPDVRHASGYGR